MSDNTQQQLSGLLHADPNVRLASIKALRNSEKVQNVELIIKTAAEDPVAYVRSEAIETLVSLNDDRIVGALAAILENDETGYVRWKAAEALGGIRSGKASEPLLRALFDPDPDIVWKAAEGLGNRRETRAVDPLIRLLAHADMYVQEKVAEALGNIGDCRALEPLHHVVNDEETAYSLDHQRFRRAAAAAIEKLGT